MTVGPKTVTLLTHLHDKDSLSRSQHGKFYVLIHTGPYIAIMFFFPNHMVVFMSPRVATTRDHPCSHTVRRWRRHCNINWRRLSPGSFHSAGAGSQHAGHQVEPGNETFSDLCLVPPSITHRTSPGQPGCSGLWMSFVPRHYRSH